MVTTPLSPVFLSGKLVNLHLVDTEIHLNDCVRWLNNSSLTKYLASGRFPQYHGDEKNWFESVAKSNDKKLVLAMHKKSDDQFIGMMGLEKINYIHRTATTGSFIGEEENRGQGYGRDAKIILLNHAFNRLNLRKINASAVAFNERSIKFNQACGYKVEGARKQQLFVEGEYYDEILLAIYADDFIPIWKKYIAT